MTGKAAGVGRNDPDWRLRSEEFARKLKATGLSITEFQRLSGLSRNVVYNLSIGQKPSSEQHAVTLEAAFNRLRK